MDLMRSNQQADPSIDENDDFVAHVLTKFAISHPRATRAAESFNTVYRVRADEGDFMLRVSRSPIIHKPNAPEAEESWTARFAEAGLAVPRIIRTAEGDLRVTDTASHRRRAMLLTWVHGSPPRHPMSRDQVIALGGLSARLHLASPQIPEPPKGVLDGRRTTLFEVPDAIATAPSPYREILAKRSQQSGEWIRDLWEDADESPRVLHFDLTPRNVVITADGTSAAIDFEDLTWGHRAQDLANSLYGVTGGNVQSGLATDFRRGYERHANWPQNLNSHLLHRLFVARRIAMINLTLTQRPHGLDEYLRRHADALAEVPV
jgi:Ser/Thr protein kinase RdoA (MazF antagonist)